MKLLPRPALSLLLALSLSNALAPLSAVARELRHPETGLPAYQFQLPDDWLIQPADQGNLLLLDAQRATVLVILVVAGNVTPEAVANEALAKYTMSSRAKEPADISGYKGYTWFAATKNSAGTDLNLEVTVVQAGAGQIASASLILPVGVGAAEEAAARKVRAALKLIPAAK
jgi:hypothetical protein